MSITPSAEEVWERFNHHTMPAYWDVHVWVGAQYAEKDHFAGTLDVADARRICVGLIQSMLESMGELVIEVVAGSGDLKIGTNKLIANVLPGDKVIIGPNGFTLQHPAPDPVAGSGVEGEDY